MANLNSFTGSLIEVRYFDSSHLILVLKEGQAGVPAYGGAPTKNKTYAFKVRTFSEVSASTKLNAITGSQAKTNQIVEGSITVYTLYNTKVIVKITLQDAQPLIPSVGTNPELLMEAFNWSIESSTTDEAVSTTSMAPMHFKDEGDPGFRPLRVPFDPYIKGPDVLNRQRTRIGYAIFDNPINYISYTRNSQIDQVPLMRESGTIKKGSGRAYESYSISYMANGPAEIRDSIADVFSQISLQPFVTVEGGPFGSDFEDGDIPHRAIAVRNFSVSTVPGLPNTLQVGINFDPFVWEYYVPPGQDAEVNRNTIPQSRLKLDGEGFRVQMDDFICWPLVKLWAHSRERSRFEDRPLNGVFELAFPNAQAGMEIDKLLSIRRNVNPIYEDLNSFKTLKQGILEKDWTKINSRNVKEIILGHTYKGINVYVLKIDQKSTAESLFPSMLGTPTDNKKRTTNENLSLVIGLIDWSKIGPMNYADDDGSFLPQSSTIDVKYLTEGYAEGKPISVPGAAVININILDITLAEIKQYQLPEAIARQVRKKYLGEAYEAADPPSSDPKYNYFVSQVAPEIAARQKDPSVYYAFVLKTSRDDSTAKGLKSWVDQAIAKLELKDSGQPANSYVNITKLVAEGFKSDPEYVVTLNDSNTTSSNIVVETISGNRGHRLTTLNTMAFPTPIHQYLGGMDATFVVQGKCFGKAAKNKLAFVKEEFDKRALAKSTSRLVTEGMESHQTVPLNGSYLRVRNEIFQLLGVDFVMPMTLSFESVDQQPDVWNFTISFIEFDPKQKYAEQIRYLPTSISGLGKLYNYGNQYRGGNYGLTNPLIERAREWYSLQDSLAQEEVYPDMMLPSKAELDTWIGAIRKAAELYKGGRLLLASSVGETNNFTKEDLAISSIVHEYIENYAGLIKKWPKDGTVTKNTSEPGAYVNPDFYCYYMEAMSWKNSFDKVGNFMFGKVGEDFNPIPNSDEHNKNVPNHREHDTQKGLRGIVSAKDMYQSAAKDTGKILTAMSAAFPKEKSDLWKKKSDEAHAQMIESSRGRWWVTDPNDYSITFDGETVRFDTDASKLLANGDLPGTGTITQGGPNPEDFWSVSGDWFKNLFFPNQTPTKENLAAAEEFADYFKSDWRRLQTIAAASWAPPGHLAANKPGGGRSNKFLFLNIEDIVKNASSFIADGLTLEDLIKEAKEQFSNPVDIQARLVKYRVPVDTNCFLFKTARINANYKFLENNAGGAVIDVVKSETGSYKDAAPNLEKNWDAVDKVCSNWGIKDPNVIRAVFFMRDGFGTFDPAATADEGFGDFDNEVTGSDKLATLNAFCKVYKRNYDHYFNSPSLALLVTHAQFLVEANRQGTLWVRSKDGVVGHLAGPFNTVVEDCRVAFEKAKTKWGENAKQILQRTISSFSSLGKYITAYQAAYNHLCKVYGSYWISHEIEDYDMFFYPLSPLILLGDEGQFIEAEGFTPTGEDYVGYASRPDAVPILPGEAKYSNNLDDIPFGGSKNLNNSSLGLRIDYTKKIRMAIEPEGEANLYGSLVDVREHSPFGKLLGAYPAFKVILINEGFYWSQGSTKLWDNFYTRTGIGSIEIFKSRHFPGGTCDIVFSNMFYNLTAYAQMEAFAHQMAVDSNNRIAKGQFGSNKEHPNPWTAATFPFRTIGLLWDDLFLKKVPEDLIRLWQNNHLKQLVLGAGCRLQVRMGYGSNCSSLPVIFNGQVVDVPVGEGYIKVTAVGDGAELEKASTQKLVKSGNSFAYADGAAFGAGRDPSVIVTEALVAPHILANLSQGQFRDFSHGIAHFGDIHFIGNLHTTAELQPNIYTSSATKIEQGIPSFDFFNFFMGLTTWNNSKSLFSVEVNEPTPWKVIEVCRRATSDFVASVETFANRSTLFFGKPWYPLHYGYSPSILTLATRTVTQDGTEEEGGFFKGTVTPGISTSYIDPTSDKEGIDALSSMADIRKKYPDQDPDDIEFWSKLLKEALEKKLNISVKGLFLLKAETVTKYYEPVESPIGTAPGGVQSHKIQYWKVLLPDNSALYYADSIAIFEEGSSISTVDRDIIEVFSGNYGPYTERRTYWKLTDLETTTLLNPSNQTSYGAINALDDVNNFVMHCKWKNYTQMFIADSMLNLLSNDIRADSTNVYTDAVGQHSYSGFGTRDSALRTITFSVDSDISAADRKTMLVETGIALTGTQAGWEGLSLAAAKFGSHFPVVGGLVAKGVAEYVQATPSTPAIQNGVVAALCDQVKEMYQGWFTIVGQPTIKPRDMMSFSDHINDLRGPCTVKEVIHRMDTEGGFITLISPDAIVLPANSFIGAKWYTSMYFFGKRVTSFYINRIIAASVLAILKSGAFRGDKVLVERASIFKALVENAKTKDSLEASRRIGTQFREDIRKIQEERKAAFLNEELNIGSAGTERKMTRGEIIKEYNLMVERGNAAAAKEMFPEAEKIFAQLKSQGLVNTEKLAELNRQLAKGGGAIDFELLDSLRRDFNLASTGVEADFFTLKILNEQRVLDERLATYLNYRIQSQGPIRALDAGEAYAAQERINYATQGDFIRANEKQVAEALGLPTADAETLSRDFKQLEKFRNTGVESLSTADKKAYNELLAKYGRVYDAEGKGLLADIERMLATEKAEIEKILKLTSGKLGDSAWRFLHPGTAAERAAEAEAAQVAKLGEAAAKQPTDGAKHLVGQLKQEFDEAKELMNKAKKLKESGKAADLVEADKLLKLASEIGLKRARATVAAAWEFGKEGVMSFRLAKYATASTPVGALIQLVMFTIGSSLIHGVNARLAARQCVKIMPLVAGKLPYTAGIKGHQGAVVSDQPGWLDVNLRNLLDPSYGGGNPIGWTALFLGFEMPEQADNDVDQQWLDYYGEYVKANNSSSSSDTSASENTALILNNEIGFDA